MKTKFAKILIAFLIIPIIIIPQTGCNDTEPVTDSEYYLDTICKLTVYDMDGGMTDDKAKEAIQAGFDETSRLEGLLSNTVDGSDISNINAADGQWVQIGADAKQLISDGIKYGDISEGKFDITVGTLSDLWDFHSDDPVVPAQSDIDEALKHVDYTKIEMEGNNIKLDDPESKIDLGGIAKGYIADKVADKMEESGVTSGIVNLGGNIVTIGSKPDGSDFIIGIEKPGTERTEIIGKTEISNGSVVTSGIYERKFVVDGVTYHHILDVKTGYPTDTDVEAVSLVADRGKSEECDALSTICLMSGMEKGQELINSADGVEAVFSDLDGNIEKTKNMKFEKTDD